MYPISRLMKNSLPLHAELGASSELAQLFGDTRQPDDELQVDLKRLFWGIWQRRVIILLVTFVTTIASCLIAFGFLEPTWSGRTTLLKKEQQDEFRVGRFGLPFKLQEYSFNTLLDTLLLPGTLEQAMQRTGVHLPNHEFSKLIEVQVNKESKAFTLGVIWNDPKIAAELTNNLAEVFLQRNRQLRRNEIEENLSRYRERLDITYFKSMSAADELMAFESKNGISDMKTQLIVLLEKRQEVEVDLREIEADLLAKKEQINRLDHHIRKEPEMIVQSSYYVNPMKKNLAALEWELSKATGRYTKDNPKVKDLLHRIEKLKTLVAEGKDKSSPADTFARNPVREELTVRTYEAMGEAIRLTSQVDQLRSMVDELSARIVDLTRKRQAHQALITKREAVDNLWRDLRQRVDSLTVLLLGRLGDFELLERSAVPTDHRGTGRKLFVLFCVSSVFFITILISVALEFFDPRLRTLKDLEFVHNFGLLAEFESVDCPDIKPDEPASSTAIQFRQFSNDLQIALEKSGTDRVAFASAEAGSGTSTVAGNTALSMHLKGESTMLVDADLRPDARPLILAENYCSPLADADLPGILKGRYYLPQNANERTSLFLISAGNKQSRNSESVLGIGGQAMTAVRNKIEQLRDWSIYILPPIAREEAAFEALKQIGTAVLVVRSGQSSTREVEHTVKRMEHHGIEIIAGVITDVPKELTSFGSLEPIKSTINDFRCLWTKLVNQASVQLAQRQA